MHGTTFCQLLGVGSWCRQERETGCRGHPEDAQPPHSSLDYRDAQLEGPTGDNELELEPGTSAQEEGRGGEGQPHGVPGQGIHATPPPHLHLFSSPDQEGVVEAVACFAYTGRTAQELTFQRGDILRLHERASGDWWRCEHAGARGLIPHKYITLPAG